MSVAGWVERSQVYLLYDLSGLAELGTRLDAYFQEHDTSVTARLSFCERDLVLWAEQLGFRDVHLDFTIDIEPVAPMSWEQALHWRPNPCAPTLEEAIRAAFTSAERRVVSDQLRPLVEAGDAVHRRAIAHVVARKP